MMQRREFLRRCGLIAAGVVAADQLDVLEMLAPRRLFAGADFSPQWTSQWTTSATECGGRFSFAKFRKTVGMIRDDNVQWTSQWRVNDGPWVYS